MEMSAAAVGDPVQGANIRATIPLGRVASTKEIAGPVVFLCTPLAGFISGEVLNVNGGAVLVVIDINEFEEDGMEEELGFLAWNVLH